MKKTMQHQQAKLTDQQMKEILRRDKAFTEGKITARLWEDVRKELEKVYR